MRDYVTTFTRRDGTMGKHLGTFPDGVTAVQHVAAQHPEACSIVSEVVTGYAVLPRAQHAPHDTQALPPGGFYFAPGVIEERLPTRVEAWRRLMLECMALLAVAGALGALAGYLQAKGWPL